MQTYQTAKDGGNNGPLKMVLVGPPGTGKTRTALEDFIKPALLRRERVLACSFSNAAADELNERLGLKRGLRGDDKICSTIHSAALTRIKVLRGDDLRLYDGKTDSVKKLKRNAVPDNVGSEGGAQAEIAARASSMSRGLMLQGEDAERWVSQYAFDLKALPSTILAKIEYFNKRKKDEGAIDYTDMLELALRAPIRELDLILLDEAQDCTPLQWAVFDHWAKGAKRVVLIGDPDQCIGEWMGASYSTFMERIREWDSRVLSKSWRVPLAAHGAAREIISRVDDREDAEYSPSDRDGSIKEGDWSTVLSACDRACKIRAEADEIMVDGELVTEETESVFILCRTNYMVDRAVRKLKEEGIPTALTGNEVAPMMARAAFELAQTGKAEGDCLRRLIAALPVRKYFNGMKRKGAEEVTSGLGSSFGYEQMPWLKSDATAFEMLEDAKVTNADHWRKMASKYPLWMLTDPPQIEVMTFHKSKGREADTVCIDADRPPKVEAPCNDSELRCLYVAITRTRDATVIFNTGKAKVFEEILEVCSGTNAAPF